MKQHSRHIFSEVYIIMNILEGMEKQNKKIVKFYKFYFQHKFDNLFNEIKTTTAICPISTKILNG